MVTDYSSPFTPERRRERLFERPIDWKTRVKLNMVYESNVTIKPSE